MLSHRKAASVAAGLVLLGQLPFAAAQIAGAQGCFSSSGDMVNQGSAQYQSSMHCWEICSAMGSSVLGLQLANCWCGDLLPPADALVDDSQCSAGCNGFGEPCGAARAWTVYLTNPNNPVGNSNDDDSSSSSSSSSSSPDRSTSTPSSTSDRTTSTRRSTAVTTETVVNSAGMTAIFTKTVTPSARPTQLPDNSDDSAKGPNKGGIIAGVVVGVVALIAIIVAVWWFMRKRKNRMEGHQRVQSTNAFATAGAGPGTMDARLDPGMVQRRDSTGSVFADNQDYSRRILRVANPDNR